MIHPVTLYAPICDGCNMTLDEPAEYGKTKEEAYDAALESGWHNINGKLYCPDCSEYDEESDEWTLKSLGDDIYRD